MKRFFARNKDILSIAIPSIVSNITVPLLGLVDLSIVGHIGNGATIGAIAVGSMIFNVIYWVFGFLRMGTSGMTAQALGKKDVRGTQQLLSRSIFVALAVAGLMVLFQSPLLHAALWAMPVEHEALHLVNIYYRICIWGAPAMLCLYGLTGWFIGMQNTRITMFVSITQNIVNIAASLCFVYIGRMNIEGVALGTLTAQYAGLACSLWFLFSRYQIPVSVFFRKDTFERSALCRFFNINRDIFLRTLCLVSVNLYFVATGARLGTEILAANALLMQLFTLFSYVMDGFAYAGEALCGRYHGANDRSQFDDTAGRLFKWAAVMVVVYTGVYWCGGDSLLALLTNDKNVISTASSYIGWAYAIPLSGAAAFVWDGIFIGTTDSKKMLQSAGLAAILFFVVEKLTADTMGNHGLWLAFLLYLAARGGIQTWMFWRMRQKGA